MFVCNSFKCVFFCLRYFILVVPRLLKKKGNFNKIIYFYVWFEDKNKNVKVRCI